MRNKGRVAAVLTVIAALAAWSSTSVWAIPAFARKYHTSCQTCHTAFPNLTPFGESFRLNGFRFPAGTDASVSKDEPIALGAEGYKKLWPKAVWPGEIPGLPPISVVVESEIANDRAGNDTSFAGLAGELALLTGGTLGQHISFYGEVEFAREDGQTEVGLERIYAGFRPLSGTALQFKVGAFEPGIAMISNHRRLTDHQYFLTTQMVGDNEFALEPFQQGIEFFGVVRHRFLYTAGYVEGSGNEGGGPKDYYGRIAYKVKGLRLDGTTAASGGTSPGTNPKPWSEKSATFSVFGYRGNSQLAETDTVLMNDPLTNIVTPVETTMEQPDSFTMYGGDVTWRYLDLIVRAGGSKRTDDSPYLGDPGIQDVRSTNLFGEVQVVALPWLIPAARWESFEVENDKTEQISLTINFLVRANVKCFLASNAVSEEGSSYQVEEIVGGVVVGF